MKSHLAAPGLELHRELLRLTRGVGGLRLAIADGVERLVALGGIEALGFPTVEAYARERLGRSGRWVGDARTLKRRLESWPALREAYLSGIMSASKVELLARHVARLPTTEVTPEGLGALIARAETMTVRALRAELGEAGEESRRWVQLTRRVERVDAVAFEGAVRLMEALGETTRAAAVEGMLAEGLVSLLNGAELDAALVRRIAGAGPSEFPVAEVENPAHTDIGPSDKHLADDQSADSHQPKAGIAPPLIDASVDDISRLDLALRDLSAELARRDLRLGELALELGPCCDTFYRDVLGLAPSSMAARIALARRIQRLPSLRAAIEAGRIGFESATLLARVASPDTEAAWLDLAVISTTKIFREHIDAAELHARVEGRSLRGLWPPTVAEVEGVRELERQVLTTVFESREPAPSPMPVSGTGQGESEPTPGLGKVDLRLALPEDLAWFWSELEVLHADAGFPGESFVAFITRATLDTWRGHARLPAYGDIYLRDRFRCQNPVCRSRHVTPHHIVFRSRGGGDDPSNLTSLCDRCHLTLVHGGHLRVTGLAPDALRWELTSRKNQRRDGWTRRAAARLTPASAAPLSSSFRSG